MGFVSAELRMRREFRRAKSFDRPADTPEDDGWLVGEIVLMFCFNLSVSG
jgi:hypothetical protein